MKSIHIIEMSVKQNECMIFPVHQIISTSIGAMCTALLMVEKEKKKSWCFFCQLIISSRHHLMLLEYDCNLNNIN